MALHVKKGDMVQIIAGEHMGATGRVLRVMPNKQKVIVQGHNVAKKHVRPSRRNPQGGRISVEQPIHISNVLPIGGKSGKATRVRHEVRPDGSKWRVGLDGKDIAPSKKAPKQG